MFNSGDSNSRFSDNVHRVNSFFNRTKIGYRDYSYVSANILDKFFEDTMIDIIKLDLEEYRNRSEKDGGYKTN